VTGHIEGDAFVVRPLLGGAPFQVPIKDIYARAASANSEVLLLGCRAACAVAHTGPLHDITAQAVIAGLQTLDPHLSALDFFKRLSERAGPILIQDDHRGGFMILDDLVGRRDNLKWAQGGGLVRMSAQASRTESGVYVRTANLWTIERAMTTAVKVLLFLLIAAPLLGWAYAVLLGLGPKRVWKQIKKARSQCLDGADPLQPIPMPSRALYVLYGPWISVVHTIGSLALLFAIVIFAVASWPAALLTLIMMLASAVRLSEDDAPELFGREDATDDDRRGGVLLAVLLTSLLAGAASVATLDPDALHAISADLGGDDVQLHWVSWRLIWSTSVGVGIFGVILLVALWIRPRLVAGASTVIYATTADLPILLLTGLERRVNAGRAPSI
jgi:hypothetical protein